MANMAVQGLSGGGAQAQSLLKTKKTDSAGAEKAQAQPAFSGGQSQGNQNKGEVTLTQKKYETLVKAASQAPGGFDSSAP